jgi:SAM-dependent methyltransferase
MVKEARENLAGYDNVRCERVGEASLSIIADDSVDVVFGQGVLTYMDPAALLALLDEVHRVLRPSGTCVFNFVTIDDEASVRYLLQAVRAGARKGRFSPAVERPYAKSQIEAMYRAVGLDVIPPPSGDARGRTNVVGRKRLRPERSG